jgi:hypothetical protein
MPGGLCLVLTSGEWMVPPGPRQAPQSLTRGLPRKKAHPVQPIRPVSLFTKREPCVHHFDVIIAPYLIPDLARQNLTHSSSWSRTTKRTDLEPERNTLVGDRCLPMDLSRV